MFADVSSEPRSATDALARLVVRVIPAERDPRTMAAWAELANASTGAVRQRCYAASVSPKRALQFARLLRAVVRADGQPWTPEEWLETADVRTLRALVRKGGLPLHSDAAPSISDFLAVQTLLDRSLIDAVQRRLIAVLQA